MSPPHWGPPPPGGESSMSALKVRAQKEEELRQVEEYWQNRVKDLRNHVRII